MSDDQSTDTTPIVQLADIPASSFSINSGSPAGPATGFDKSKLIMPAAILIAGVMISGSILYARYNAGKNQNFPANIGGQIGTKVNIDIKDAPALGDVSAPVTVIEFGDFQCPYCQRYAQNNQPLFISEYVDKGKARFVWKDYAFLGQESLWAAVAARCANEQGKFWEYHNYLYSHQGAENSGAFSKVNLKKFGIILGLNATQFNSCLDTDKYASLIQQETQAGSSVGVNGTPATFVNGKMVVGSDGNSVGAAPFSVFKSVIDKELNR